MDRESIVDKVRKLLKLAKDKSNENESRAAFLLAQKLLLKHRIEQEELGKEDQEVIETYGLRNKHRIDEWKKRVAATIASNFRCKIIFEYDKGEVKNKRTVRNWSIKFVGLKADAEIAAEVYQAAIEHADQYRKLFLFWERVNKWRDHTRSEAKQLSIDWNRGFAEGLSNEFTEQVRANGWELIIVVPEAVELHYGRIKTGKHPSEYSYVQDHGNDAAFRDGKTKGEAFASNHKQRTPERKLLTKGEHQ